MMIGEKLDPRKTFGAAIDALAEQNDRIVVMSADSGGSSGHKAFMKNHPDRYYECGIMEQGVTGIAAGLATTGKIPVFCAIAPFVTSGGSGFSGTIGTIESMEPDAAVTEGLSLRSSEAADPASAVTEWLAGIGLAE